MFMYEDLGDKQLYLVKLEDNTMAIGYYDNGCFFDERGECLEEDQSVTKVFPIPLDHLSAAFVPIPKEVSNDR